MRFKTMMIIAILLSSPLALAVPPYVDGQVVVSGTPESLPGYRVVKYLPNANLTVVAVESGREWGHLQKLTQHGRRAGLNFKAHKSGTVNDTFYSPYQWHLSHVQSEQAWSLNIGGGAEVAVLDTGLATGGHDGINCVSSGIDIVNGDNDPFDGDGHGTHVSGTIAQTTNNSEGTAGLAYGACIIPVKVLDDTGGGSFADIAEGIHWAVDNGAHVINMSLGINARYGVTNDPIMDPALEYALAQGVTVVCAAGNDGSRKNVGYPAIYPTTIAVGATGYDNQIVSYSNRGTGLDLVAPGGNTGVDLNGDGYGDGVLQETLIDGSWGYYFFQGTSMSCPHVAAAAAMLISNGTATTPAEVFDALTTSTLDLGQSGFDSTYGHGLLQVYDALTGGGGCVPETEDCFDGLDNDCDGFIDEDDPDCQGGDCLPIGSFCSIDQDCCTGNCVGKKKKKCR